MQRVIRANIVHPNKPLQEPNRQPDCRYLENHKKGKLIQANKHNSLKHSSPTTNLTNFNYEFIIYAYYSFT